MESLERDEFIESSKALSEEIINLFISRICHYYNEFNNDRIDIQELYDKLLEYEEKMSEINKRRYVFKK